MQIIPGEGPAGTIESTYLAQPEIISYSDVKSAVIMSLYQPVLFFPQLARVLQALEEGNGLLFLEMAISRGYRSPAFSCNCDSSISCSKDAGWPLKAVGNGDGDKFVRCGEGLVPEHRDSIEILQEYYAKLEKKSPMSAPVMFEPRLACTGWQARAKWRFTGMQLSIFDRSEYHLANSLVKTGPFEVNTSYPVLFIGNTADNITPLGSAVHDSSYFQDSVVLIQNSFGVSLF